MAEVSGAPETKDVSCCPSGCMPSEDDRGNCSFLMSAYILAGLAMMLNIRLSYSSAPYALIRFQLPENLFSVFVRRMASSLEIWCLPGFIIADAIELAVKLVIKLCENDGYGNNTLKSKELKFKWIIVPSIVAQWLNFLTYVILLIVYLAGDDQGHLTTFYFVIAVSGFVFGINNVFVFAADYNYIPIYIAGENCFPALTSFIHYITTLSFGNRRKYDSDFIIVYIDIFVAIIISFVAAMVWTIAYGYSTYSGPFEGKITYTTTKDIKKIIITGITGILNSPTEAKTPTATPGTVKIKTGPVKEGQCKDTIKAEFTDPAPEDIELGGALATITTQDDKGPTLTIYITITDDATNKDSLDALAHIATLDGACKVDVDTSNKKLTITIKYRQGANKCTKTEITLTGTGSTDLTDLGLKTGTTTATVNVSPTPNHLTIKYKNTTKTAAHPKTAAKDAQSMTAITEKIAKDIKEATTTGSETKYYQIPYKTKITYYFTLTQTQARRLNDTAPIKDTNAKIIVDYGHIFAEGFSDTDAKASMISPLLIVLVGMGLVYAIYPGIAPGMIVPFYLVDKIEMVLLIATIFPPVIIALLQRFYPNWSPKTKFLLQKFKFGGWEQYNDDDFSKGWPPTPDPNHVVYAQLWHFFDLLIVTMIILAYIFIYSLHYRESNISRAIVNQPKMSTALTIVFYMCHEISLAVGFPGMVANAAEYTVIAQMVGAFLMVFLALYSEGYIIEYKSHDPKHWPRVSVVYIWHYFLLYRWLVIPSWLSL
uniref:Theileria-specific sub-telomeric protein, putative n=1 Tax=Theileria annulata TaxID=5874 RepID=A0A3B0N1C9_THEAN